MVKVTGVVEKEHENMEDLVAQLFSDIEADVTPDDISAVHRKGPKAKNNGAKKPCPILVKLTSRRKKAALV